MVEDPVHASCERSFLAPSGYTGQTTHHQGRTTDRSTPGKVNLGRATLISAHNRPHVGRHHSEA